MTRKTIIGLTTGIIGIVAVAGVALSSISTAPQMSDLMVKNLEVLSRDENDTLDTSYTPRPYSCDMYVGVKGTFLGISAGADGYVRIGGARDCEGGGNSTCKPISCPDVYASLRK